VNTVFITGAASGIGRATAEYLYKQGWKLGIADLNLIGLRELTGSWDQQRVQCYELDVSNNEQAKAVIDDFCHYTKGQLDVLINNAGILKIGSFEALDISAHQQTINVNVMGVIHCSLAALPYLKNTPRSKVINLSSASSMYGIPELASYSASKFAVKALTEALELEWKKYDIDVCDVVPPFVATQMIYSQQDSSKIMEALGVNLAAEDVVRVISKQIESPNIHRSVGFQFSLMYFLNTITPPFVSRLCIKYLSR